MGEPLLWFSSILFVIFTIVSALVVLSLFIGVITTSMQAATEEEAQRVQREKLQAKMERRDISRVHTDATALLTWDGKPKNGKQDPAAVYAGCRLQYYKFSQRCQKLVYSKIFTTMIIFVTLVAGINTGVQTYTGVVQDTGGICLPAGCKFNCECEGGLLTHIDTVVLAVFTLEMLLKFVSLDSKPWRYFFEAWNIFDFTIVLFCMLPIGGAFVSVLRLLRLLRVLKLVKSLPQLQVIVSGLLQGMSSIGYILMLLGLVFYLYGVVGMMMFRKNDPWHFGDLHTTMVTLFRCSTLEDWTDVMYINMYGCDKYFYHDAEWSRPLCVHPSANEGWTILYFVTFIVLSALVMLSLFIGVVTNSMQEATLKMKFEAEVAGRVELLRQRYDFDEDTIASWKTAFTKCDVDDSGSIDFDELEKIFKLLGVPVTEEELLHKMSKADKSGDNEVDFAEFCELLLAFQEEHAETERLKQTAGAGTGVRGMEGTLEDDGDEEVVRLLAGADVLPGESRRTDGGEP